MNFSDYKELEQKANKAGIVNDPALKQLLHILQAKNIAIEHHRAYMKEMNEWEKNIASFVERKIEMRAIINPEDVNEE